MKRELVSQFVTGNCEGLGKFGCSGMVVKLRE
jgi:hypothetical protein